MGNEIEKLIQLLDSPETLKSRISYLKKQSDNSEAILGFIELYDQLHGDCTAIKAYFNESEMATLKLIPKKQFKIGNYLKYAAILIVFLSIGGYYFLNQSSNSENIHEYYQDPGLPNFMSSDQSNSIKNIENILFEFNKKNYKKSIQLIEKQLTNNSKNDTLNYYLGLNHFYENQYLKSIQDFQKIQNSNSIFSDRIYYFSALIDINEKDYINAKKSLIKIKHTNDENLKIAVKKLLNHIESETK